MTSEYRKALMDVAEMVSAYCAGIEVLRSGTEEHRNGEAFACRHFLRRLVEMMERRK